MPMRQRTDHTPKLSLEPGTRLLARFGWGAEPGPDEIAGELVGCVHYEYIVLRFYPRPGLLARLLSGSQAKLRFMQAGVASEFTVSVLTHITRPSLLVFLTYPRSITNLSIRQFQRVQSALPALLQVEAGELRGSVTDVSLGGCQLVVDARGQSGARALQSGSFGALQVCLDADGTTSSSPCTLRNIETEQFHVFVGLAFIDPDTSFRQRLSDYLEMVRHSS